MPKHFKDAKHIRPHVGTYSFRHDVPGEDYEEFEILSMVRHPGWVLVGEDEFILDFVILQLRGQSKRTPVKLNRFVDVPLPGQSVHGSREYGSR
jgi:hypothetical protein